LQDRGSGPPVLRLLQPLADAVKLFTKEEFFLLVKRRTKTHKDTDNFFVTDDRLNT
jgi:hypothetical protein